MGIHKLHIEVVVSDLLLTDCDGLPGLLDVLLIVRYVIVISHSDDPLKVLELRIASLPGLGTGFLEELFSLLLDLPVGSLLLFALTGLGDRDSL